MFYLTVTNAMTAEQANQMHEGSIRPLYGHYFDEKCIKILKTTNEKGRGG